MYVFDLDDTLYSERQYVRSAFRRVIAEANRRVPGAQLDPEETLRAMTTPGGLRAFDFLSKVLGPEARKAGFDIDTMVDIYRHHPDPDITPGAGVEETLAELHRRGHAIGIITDGSSRTQRSKIKALGLEKYVHPQAVIISGETGADKHTPMPFDTLRSRFPAEKEWVYIGDNPAKDFRHPNLSGWRTVMLAAGGDNVFGQHLDAYAPEYRPQTIIYSIPDLLK